jgi:hypothetical protein
MIKMSNYDKTLDIDNMIKSKILLKPNINVNIISLSDWL